jgi:UrcA family protein
MKKLTTLLTLGTIAATLAMVTPSYASEEPVETRRVQFDDLDLSKPAGARTLYKRIRGAAGRVCNEAWKHANGAASHEVAKCIRSAVDAAVDHVDSATLTTVHEEIQWRTVIASR